MQHEKFQLDQILTGQLSSFVYFTRPMHNIWKTVQIAQCAVSKQKDEPEQF